MSAPFPKFGTDGIRGVANETLTPHVAMVLGMAAAYVLGRHSSERHFLVGRDTRLSGLMLEAGLNAGLSSMGAIPISIGVIPTPAVARLTLRHKAVSGVVISASHNPYEDNGVKFFGNDGRKLSDEVEEEIENAMSQWETLPRPLAASIGVPRQDESMRDEYLENLLRMVDFSLKGVRIVLDCANGAAYDIAPKLFSELGAEVCVIHHEPDGVNINLDCGSTHPAQLSQKTKEFGAAAGLAFDGDCDRVMMCDENGDIVDGDKMMAICALNMKKRRVLNPAAVVATVMSNAGLEVALNNAGIQLIRTDVGDRYVAEEMHRIHALIGGEQSGHILLPNLTPTGDGMVTGLQILKVMRNEGKPLSELASVVRTCPQLLKNVRVKDRLAWKSDPVIQKAISDARSKLTKPEWLSVRPSGTEPLVRVMAQDTDAERVEEVVHSLCDLISATA